MTVRVLDPFLAAQEEVAFSVVRLDDDPRTTQQWRSLAEQFDQAERAWKTRLNKVLLLNKIGAGMFLVAILVVTAWRYQNQVALLTPIWIIAAVVFAAFLTETIVFGAPSRGEYPLQYLSPSRFENIAEGCYEEVRAIAMTDAVVQCYVRAVLAQGRDLNHAEFFAIQTRHERAKRELAAEQWAEAGMEARSALQAV